MTNTLLATDRLQSPLLMRQAEKPTCVSYGPYGDRTPRANTPVSGFTGQPCEQYLSWYLLGNGHRTYNPMTMRFHSPDGLSPFGRGGLNTYAYCHGDPINFHDRSGRSRWLALWTTVKDYVPDWVSPTITNGVNIAGASQPALTIAAHAVADEVNNTSTVNLRDPRTLITGGSSLLATAGAVGEALGYPTGVLTAIGNSGVISIGIADTVDTISDSNQAGALQNIPEAMPMTNQSHTVVGGLETDEAVHQYPPLSINLGGRRLRTPQAVINRQQTEIATLRRRIRQLESKN